MTAGQLRWYTHLKTHAPVKHAHGTDAKESNGLDADVFWSRFKQSVTFNPAVTNESSDAVTSAPAPESAHILAGSTLRALTAAINLYIARG